MGRLFFHRGAGWPTVTGGFVRAPDLDENAPSRCPDPCQPFFRRRAPPTSEDKSWRGMAQSCRRSAVIRDDGRLLRGRPVCLFERKARVLEHPHVFLGIVSEYPGTPVAAELHAVVSIVRIELLVDRLAHDRAGPLSLADKDSRRAWGGGVLPRRRPASPAQRPPGPHPRRRSFIFSWPVSLPLRLTIPAPVRGLPWAVSFP